MFSSFLLSQVVENIARKFGVSKSDLLDREADDLAVRIALGETQVIAETKKALLNAGVNTSSLEEFAAGNSDSVKRSNHVILVKNLPYGALEAELANMFGKFGSLDKIILPPTKTLALVFAFSCLHIVWLFSLNQQRPELLSEIKSLRLPMRFGNHRGFAFVEYVTKQEAQNALEALSSTHFYGRHLVLERAKEGESLEELRARTAAQFTDEQSGYQNPTKLSKKRKHLSILDEGSVKFERLTD
ncbi:hypothetical protein RJ640_011628 [Escallonia rubra]|uniref:RRM domain-containing protein n=1 Tax=Escallonia rubra TaxID=112253 RepID=A0AA88S646_9ASTE|nr:hypothetical protein RJ640_011628 [Escallonia rubra]